jgi:hypothetical protein
MEPRIYTYKITFEEVPHWYWGVHKEEKFNEEYWGTPVTNRRYWGWYTPKKQILEVFETTEEGWKKANEVEDRLIRPDLNNSLCLNEGIGGYVSLKVLKDNNKIIHREKNQEGKSINAVKAGKLGFKKVHAEKNEEGKSKHAVTRGLRGGKSTHSRKDENGKSLHNAELNKKLHAEKTPDGKSVLAQRIALELHSVKNEEGKSIAAVQLAQLAHSEKDENGKSVLGVKNGKKSLSILLERNPNHQRDISLQKWMDPDHPELGHRNSGVLARLQKKNGYPSERRNRVKVDKK